MEAKEFAKLLKSVRESANDAMALSAPIADSCHARDVEIHARYARVVRTYRFAEDSENLVG